MKIGKLLLVQAVAPHKLLGVIFLIGRKPGRPQGHGKPDTIGLVSHQGNSQGWDLKHEINGRLNPIMDQGKHISIYSYLMRSVRTALGLSVSPARPCTVNFQVPLLSFMRVAAEPDLI